MADDRARKREIERRYRDSHREVLRARFTAYNAAHREERKAWRVANRERIAAAASARWRSQEYGITAEMFDEYLDAQEGACAYCGHELPRSRSKIAVDHDHATGAFRGLLHIPCNASLGAAEKHYDGYIAAAAMGNRG